ncbi:Oligopeptide transporter 2 [Yarrowia sp. B02]|nr:Oligopeptide transporter 2 [Yarrowia sp. B02]
MSSSDSSFSDVDLPDKGMSLDEEFREITDVSDLSPEVLEYVAKLLGIPPSELDGSYPPEVIFIATRFTQMSEDQAVEIVRRNLKVHAHDPNFNDKDRTFLRELLECYTEKGPSPTSSPLKSPKGHIDTNESLDSNEQSMLLRYWATLFYWWSPYPEVRSVTDPFDDETQLMLTWRVWVLGTIWVGLGSFVTTFFEPRLPAIVLGAPVCQLLMYPSGRLVQYILPDWGFSFRGHRFTLNPGKWSRKEQLLATIMLNCSIMTPYVSQNILVQYMPVFYNQQWAGQFGYGFLMLLTTQFMGFGLSGLLRRVGCYPVTAMWPTVLPTLAVNKALMEPGRKGEKINGWTMSRYKCYFVFFVGSFLWFWVPNYLWTATSTWNWMTWIAPNNPDLAIVTGSISGLGYNPIPTFDWNIVTGIIEPLMIPFNSSLNQYIGMFLSGLFILAVYYTNNNYTKWIPINDNLLYDNTGNPFDVKRILTDSKFDETKYRKYSPPYYSAASLVLLGANFALYPMAFLYSVLCHWRMMASSLKDTWVTLRYLHRSNYHGLEDPFCRIQKKHKEVPDFWYYTILLVMIGLMIAMVEHWPTNTPVWIIFLCLGMSMVFLLPFCIFYSLTGVMLSLTLMAELIVGYALPGKFQALNTAKALMAMITEQAMNFNQDQKQTHYAHLPPRSIFFIQLWGTMVNSLVTLGVLQFQMHDVKNICQKNNTMKFTCPNENTTFSASVVWGIIGPKRIFDDQYPVLKWMFLLGAGVALVFWGFQFALPALLLKKYPHKRRHISSYQRIVTLANPLTLCSGMLFWAPRNLSYFTGMIYVATLFNWYLLTRFQAWWRKYTYVVSAGLDTGVALSGIVIFFAVQYNDYALPWWGNTVSYAGMDGQGVPIPPLPERGYFGPSPENYP